MSGRCNKLLVALLLAPVIGLGMTSAAAKEKKSPEPRSLVGTPQVVRDLHWGDVLFYFYQDDHLQALTRLGAAQDFNRVSHHGVEAELLKGGLYLSLGQHEEAGRIFKALLNDNVPLDVRNRAWFYLAKVWYQRDYRRGATIKLEKGVGAKYVELKISDKAVKAQPEFIVKEWE